MRDISAKGPFPGVERTVVALHRPCFPGRISFTNAIPALLQ
jgi:hypothetical protein